jgi:hypothetical protein
MGTATDPCCVCGAPIRRGGIFGQAPVPVRTDAVTRRSAHPECAVALPRCPRHGQLFLGPSCARCTADVTPAEPAPRASAAPAVPELYADGLRVAELTWGRAARVWMSHTGFLMAGGLLVGFVVGVTTVAVRALGYDPRWARLTILLVGGWTVSVGAMREALSRDYRRFRVVVLARDP